MTYFQLVPSGLKIWSATRSSQQVRAHHQAPHTSKERAWPTTSLKIGRAAQASFAPLGNTRRLSRFLLSLAYKQAGEEGHSPKSRMEDTGREEVNPGTRPRRPSSQFSFLFMTATRVSYPPPAVSSSSSRAPRPTAASTTNTCQQSIKPPVSYCTIATPHPLPYQYPW